MASPTCGNSQRKRSPKKGNSAVKPWNNASSSQADNMGKMKLFEDDEEEVEEFGLDVNTRYAKKYEHWKKKEERQQLVERYGKDADELESSSSEEEDENGDRLPPDFDKNFLHTLACLRKKDSSIYNKDHKFFSDEKIALQVKSDQKKKSDKPMYLHDYEREVLLSGNGNPIEEEDFREAKTRPATYMEEQEELKNSLKKALEDSDDDDGDLFTISKKSSDVEPPEQQKGLLDIKGIKNEIKNVWSGEVDESEAFLRDFILQQKHIDEDNRKRVPTYEEIVAPSDESDNESFSKEQETFEHKFNFRFEEPDQEFIKRYPRTITQTFRVKDAKRSDKRSEIKQRKQKEKVKKLNELKRLKALKRAEIMEKLEKIKKITGNTKVGFGDVDLDEDFNPDQHDKRMQQIFDDEYYKEEETEEPEIPFEDEDLQGDNWDEWNGDDGQLAEPHCEDPNFVMDCDYDPSAKEHLETNKSGKKKKRGNLRNALQKKKPIFDPASKTFEDYFDEYYKLDYEDIIGDLPCRFKYRSVLPNNFGLSVEEVLTADDKELNQWCSLKKACQYRSEQEEKFDIVAYNRQANNLKKKSKILKSIYQTEEDEETEESSEAKTSKNQKKRKRRSKDAGSNSILSETNLPESNQNSEAKTPKKKRKRHSKDAGSNSMPSETNLPESNQNSEAKTPKKKRKRHSKDAGSNSKPSETNLPESNQNSGAKTPKGKNRKRKRHPKDIGSSSKKVNNGTQSGIPDSRLKAYGINPKKFNNKLKYGKSKQAAE